MQGAAEIVLGRCTSVMTAEGVAVPLSDSMRNGMLGDVTQMASQGLRTLCLSYKDLGPADDLPADGTPISRPADEDLTACCIVGIKVRCALRLLLLSH